MATPSGSDPAPPPATEFPVKVVLLMLAVPPATYTAPPNAGPGARPAGSIPCCRTRPRPTPWATLPSSTVPFSKVSDPLDQMPPPLAVASNVAEIRLVIRHRSRRSGSGHLGYKSPPPPPTPPRPSPNRLAASRSAGPATPAPGATSNRLKAEKRQIPDGLLAFSMVSPLPTMVRLSLAAITGSPFPGEKGRRPGPPLFAAVRTYGAVGQERSA